MNYGIQHLIGYHAMQAPPPLDSFEGVVQDTECYESRHEKGDVSPLDNELFGFLVLYT